MAYLPARSTRLREPWTRVAVGAWRPVMKSMKMEWLRDELAFMAVHSEALAAPACLISPAAVSGSAILTRLAPTTEVGSPAQ